MALSASKIKESSDKILRAARKWPRQKEVIIWAVNPFDEYQQLERPQFAFEVLRHLSERLHCDVEPTYIASPASLNSPIPLKIGQGKQLRDFISPLLVRAIDRAKLTLLRPARILVEPKGSLQRTVEALVHSSVRRKAKFIFCQTRALTGMERFFLGSFTENLIHLSKTPLLLVNPNCRPQFFGKKILFATDLSKKSERAWPKLCELAASLHAEIEIFHILAAESRLAALPAATLTPEFFIWSPEIYGDYKKRMLDLANRFVRKAAGKGVKVSVHMQEGIAAIYELINERAKLTNADLIAIAVKSGPTKAKILGSTADRVVRTATVPVWLD